MADDDQGFMSHLLELRTRLMRAGASVILVFLALTPFMRQIFSIVERPMVLALPPGGSLLATGVIAPFMVPLKVTLFAAFCLASPYVLYQAWAFIAPGLYTHEKRLALPVIVSSVVMFFTGMAYCYFVVFRFIFRFMAEAAPEHVQVSPDIDAYWSLVLRFFIAFGLAFEVPIIVMLLVRMGIVSVAKLRELRRYMIVGAIVIAAIVTPPDWFSPFLLAVPLWLLYELGVLLAGFVGKGAAAEESAGAD